MRPAVLAVLSALFAAGLPAVALAQSSKTKKDKEPEWHQHASDTFRYKAIFPGKPKDVAKRISSNVGELLVSTWSFEGKDLLYAITATKYPEKMKAADPKLVLLAAKDALSANGGKIISDDPITVPGPDGAKSDAREVIVDFSRNRVRTRLLLANNLLYQVSVTGPESKMKADTVGKFLASFEVTAEPSK
jgi:hypothetical protein